MANFIKQTRLLFTIHYYIAARRKGDAQHLASRLQISRSCFFRHLNHLREMGARIHFNDQRRGYEYLQEFDLKKELGAR